MIVPSYRVAGLTSSGRTRPGHQALDVTLAHLQQAAPSRITVATVQVSLDDGKTWQ